MRKTKIDWCDSTINCVYGCPNNCKYCYGNVMNKRFHFCKDWSKPEWKPEHLKEFNGKKPKSIFIDSMSDIGTWKSEWFDEVMSAIRRNSQHNYIALTKCLSGYRANSTMNEYRTKQYMPRNLFIGVSVTNNVPPQVKPLNVDFLSIEPILQAVDIKPYIDGVLKLVIIGAETGNRKGKVIPQKEWVDRIVQTADTYGIKVFMKGSLRKLMGDDFRQDKLPWEIER